MIPAERSFLENERLKKKHSIKDELRLLISPFVTLVFIFILLWAILTWLVRVAFKYDIGWSSQWSPWIWSFGLVLGVGLFSYELVRQIKYINNRGNSIDLDLKAGEVEEINLEFVEVKRFQEPEHGGIFHFFRTSEDQVYVMFDYESQELGVQGKNPLESKFTPARNLNIVRAITSRIILKQIFSGEPLELKAPIEMTSHPNYWPEPEEFCTTQWYKLEETYAT